MDRLTKPLIHLRERGKHIGVIIDMDSFNHMRSEVI